MSEVEIKKTEEDRVIAEALKELEQIDYVAWDKGCKYGTNLPR